MSSESISYLSQLKDFLADRPEYAFLACCIFVIVILWRALRKEQKEKFDLALRVLPLADKLQNMLQRAAERRAVSRPPAPLPPPSP